MAMRTEILIVLGSIMPLATARAQQSACDDANTTIEIRRCLASDLKKTETLLGGIEDSLKKSLGDSAAASFEDAKRAWEQYRERQCNSVAWLYLPGTMGPVMKLKCLIQMTDDRREVLKDFYSTQL